MEVPAQPAPAPLRAVERWRQFNARLRTIPGVRLAAVPLRVAAAVAAERRRTDDEIGHLGLPPGRPTMSWVASVALDELVLGLASGPSRLPAAGEMERVAAELRVAWRLYHDRGWLADPVTYHREPAPARPLIQQRRLRGVAFEHLRWASRFSPHPEEPGAARWRSHLNNTTAHAYVIRHPEPDRPWLICVHGLGTGVPLADFAAFRVPELVTSKGVNVVLPVLPRHGPRKSTRRVDEFLTHDLIDTVHGMTQAMWDLRALLGWIRAQGGTRIGMHGLSLGGYTTGLLATLDEDLGMTMAGVPLTDVPSLFAAHAPGSLRREAIEAGLLGDATDEVHRVISPLAMPARVPLQARSVYAGLADRMTTTAQALRLWHHWERPPSRWYAGNHVGVAFNREARTFVDERVTSWLDGSP